MKKVIFGMALACVVCRAGAQTPSPAGPAVQGVLLSLSCMEALVAIEQDKLAGVFSFIAEKDSSAAFADLVVHDAKALKKYAAKLGQDFKTAGGITQWDHEAVMFALASFSGPLAQTLQQPSDKLKAKLTELGLAPTLTLEQVAARRKK